MGRILKSEYELWDEAVKFVKEKNSKWGDFWEDYARWCQLIFKLYMAKNEWASLSRRARITLSIPFSIIETVAAETYRALFDEIPYWKQKPRGPEDEELADSVSLYTGYQTEVNKMRIQGYIFEKNRLMFGLSWAFVPWSYLKEFKRRDAPIMEPIYDYDLNGEKVPKSNPFTGAPMMKPAIDLFGRPVTEKQFIKETTKDVWEFQPIMPWNVRSDPAITNPLNVQCGGEGVIIDRWYSASELRKLQREGVYYNVDHFFNRKEQDYEEDQRTASSTPSYDDDEYSRNFKTGYNYKKDLIHVCQFWGKAPIVEIDRKTGKSVIWDDSSEPVECVIDATENECFRIIRNPIDEQLRPIVVAQCHPVADSLISPGIINAVESEIQEMQAFRNARMDNLSQRMNPMYIVRSGALTSTRDLRYKPFGVVRTPDPQGDIAEFPTPSLGETYDRDMGQLQYDIQNATNALSAAQTTSNMGLAFGRTARGIDFFQNRMQRRLQVIVDVAEDQFFGQLSDIVNSYNKQFLVKPEDFSVVGKENVYMTISPEAYLQRRDLIPVGAARKLNKGQMVSILDRLLTELSGFRDFAKVDVILKEFIKLTDLFPNPDKILYTEEELKKMQETKPSDFKKGLNISVNFAELDPGLKQLLLTKVFPGALENQAPSQEEMVTMAQGFPEGQLSLISQLANG